MIKTDKNYSVNIFMCTFVATILTLSFSSYYCYITYLFSNPLFKFLIFLKITICGTLNWDDISFKLVWQYLLFIVDSSSLLRDVIKELVGICLLCLPPVLQIPSPLHCNVQSITTA